jgi:hypothetical protein
MGGTACKAKVILNGGAVQDGANRLCYAVEETEYSALTDKQWTTIIEHLNVAEDSVNKAQRAYLEALGFTGPWPASLG